MAKKKKAVENISTEQPTVVVHGFKGFDKDWKCRDMQYAPGETYEEAEAKLCENGLHFCEHPLDCLGYYAPGEGSRYAVVTADNPTDEKSDDTKRVTKKLHIGAELSLGGLVEAAVKFVFDRAEWTEADKATGDYGAASATGYKGAASATGYYGSASATGEESVAMACGYKCKARACVGSWIALTERDDEGHILSMQCAIVDGDTLKPDVYYTLKDGQIVEA